MPETFALIAWAILGRLCPLWVKSRRLRCTSACPLSAPSGRWDLFDHFVSSDSEMVGPSAQVLEIDCHLKPRWHLHWQLGGFFTFEDAVNVAGHAPARFARPISRSTSGIDYELPAYH